MKLIDQIEQHFRELNEKVDRVSDKEADVGYKNLDDKDLDNDGDTDDTDSYLFNKLSTIAKNDDKDDDTIDEFINIDAMVRQYRDELVKKKKFAKSRDELPKNYNPMTGKFTDELEEMSTTAAVPGDIKTPYAFGKKEGEKGNAEVVGYKKVQESAYMRMVKQMEGLNEVSYRDYKKDPTSTPQQKVNRGIQEVNRMLAEMEKIVHNNVRLKQEMGVDSSHFWKATGRRFAKINERMTRISNRLRELSK